MDFFGAVHDHVADAGDYVGADLMGHTVFGDDVPVVAVEAAAEHHFGAFQGPGQVLQGIVHTDYGFYVEVHVHAVLLYQGVHVLALAQDDHGLFGREHVEVPLVGTHGPEHDEQELQQERGHKGERADVHPVHQQGDQEHEGVADEGGQSLAVDQFVDAADVQGEAVVQVGGKVVEEAKQEHHNQVAPVVERSPQLVFVEIFPAEPIGPGDQQDVDAIQQLLLDFFRQGCVHGVWPPLHNRQWICRCCVPLKGEKDPLAGRGFLVGCVILHPM